MAASLLALALLAATSRAEAPPPGTLPAAVGRGAQTLAEAEVIAGVRDSRVLQTQFRTPSNFLRIDETGQDFDIRFDLPGPELLFQLDSENRMIERMKQERRKYKKDELTFPEQPVLSREAYRGRNWDKTKMCVESHFVVHRRLFFEELNAERYGWEVGLFQPLLSASIFYKDVFFLPYHLWTDPCRCYETNAGKCHPGDPVPLLWYPPELSISGATAQVFGLGVLSAVFP